MCFAAYRRRLRIWETNFGREAGWFIERNGERIAVLTDPQSEEMFWDSYSIEVLTEDPVLRQRILSKEFWWSECSDLVYRNREFDDIAPDAFSAPYGFIRPGRLMMRGLYLRIGWPMPWDWFVLWIRRLLSRPHALRGDA